MHGYRRHTVLGAAIGAALWADDLVDVIMELCDIDIDDATSRTRKRKAGIF